MCSVDIMQASTVEEVAAEVDKHWDYILASLTTNGEELEKLAEIKAGLLRQREEEKESYGLYNVNERIRLRFGNQYGLSFYSEDHAGTKVEIYLPVRHES